MWPILHCWAFQSQSILFENILLTITAAQLSLLQSAQEIVLMMDCHYFWNATVCFDEAWMVSKKGGTWQLVFGTDLIFTEAFREEQVSYATRHYFSVLQYVILGHKRGNTREQCDYLTYWGKELPPATHETLKDKARFKNNLITIHHPPDETLPPGNLLLCHTAIIHCHCL